MRKIESIFTSFGSFGNNWSRLAFRVKKLGSKVFFLFWLSTRFNSSFCFKDDSCILFRLSFSIFNFILASYASFSEYFFFPKSSNFWMVSFYVCTLDFFTSCFTIFDKTSPSYLYIMVCFELPTNYFLLFSYKGQARSSSDFFPWFFTIFFVIILLGTYHS